MLLFDKYIKGEEEKRKKHKISNSTFFKPHKWNSKMNKKSFYV